VQFLGLLSDPPTKRFRERRLTHTQRKSFIDLIGISVRMSFHLRDESDCYQAASIYKCELPERMAYAWCMHCVPRQFGTRP
jgi:hypothetical protein